MCYQLFYLLIEFSFLIRYYSLLYQSLIPNCKLTINTLRQHITICDNVEKYIVGAASHRTSCQRLINFLLTRLHSEKDYMQFCYHLNIISVLTDLPYRLIAGIFLLLYGMKILHRIKFYGFMVTSRAVKFKSVNFYYYVAKKPTYFDSVKFEICQLFLSQ